MANVITKPKATFVEILRFDSLPSTNAEAAKRATNGAAEGVCIVADEQTAGRGRLDRRWVSPKGAGLYLSIILRPLIDQKYWSVIPLMTAVAVNEALNATCNLRTDIKWPNDVLFNEKKLCGILAESVDTPTNRAVVVGIGINLNDSSFPTELKEVATSVEAACGATPNAELVLSNVVDSVFSWYGELQNPEGASTLIAEYCARSSYCNGKTIRVLEGDESFIGVTRGLEPDGALRVERQDGSLRIVRAADVEQVRATNN